MKKTFLHEILFVVLAAALAITVISGLSPSARKMIKDPVAGGSGEIGRYYGERVVYKVRFKGFDVGEARYHMVGAAEVAGVKADLLRFETKVVNFSDIENIYGDRETLLPLLVEREVSRLIKPERIQEIYDQKNYVLKIVKERFGKETKTIEKDGPIHNALLLPHMLRRVPELEEGWSRLVNLPLRSYRIQMIGQREVEVPAGKFSAYYFESDPSDFRFWITADEDRIPLKIEGTSGLGYEMDMAEYQPPERERRQ